MSSSSCLTKGGLLVRTGGAGGQVTKKQCTFVGTAFCSPQTPERSRRLSAGGAAHVERLRRGRAAQHHGLVDARRALLPPVVRADRGRRHVAHVGPRPERSGRRLDQHHQHLVRESPCMSVKSKEPRTGGTFPVLRVESLRQFLNSKALATFEDRIHFRFGSLRRGSRTGTIFNNQMSDFSLPDDTDEWGLPPSEANFIEPGKRPQSSMSPTLITDSDDDVVGVIGASGGTKITTGVAYVSVFHLVLCAFDVGNKHRKVKRCVAKGYFAIVVFKRFVFVVPENICDELSHNMPVSSLRTCAGICASSVAGIQH